jgi:hypothetical protein
MVEAIEAAAAISSALAEPAALAAPTAESTAAALATLTAPSATASSRTAAHHLEPALPAALAPSFTSADERIDRPGWLRPTLSVAGAVLGLSVLGWLSGLPTVLARIPWPH